MKLRDIEKKTLKNGGVLNIYDKKTLRNNVESTIITLKK